MIRTAINSMNLEAALSFIQLHNDFILAAHKSPDGDTLGSCLGLRLALLQLGKRVAVVCPDPVPTNLQFLAGSETVGSAVEQIPEAVIYVDCGDHSRTDHLEPLLDQAAYSFCIDHHMTNPKNSKDGDWVENVAATAELIYRLISGLQVTITQEIAECLFAGIASDTGYFAYSNTTADTFRIAAELVTYGLDLSELNRRLFRDYSVAKAGLIAHVLKNMQLYENDAAAIAVITHETMVSLGAAEEDCEGLIDYLRDIDSVEIACIVRESPDGRTHVSLRSKLGADVSRIATAFGGGGHKKAAGITMDMPSATACRMILPEIILEVRKWTESSRS